MKKIITLFFVLQTLFVTAQQPVVDSLIDTNTSGQQTKASTKTSKLGFMLYATNRNILGINMWGPGIDFTYYPTSSWGTGIVLNMTSKKTSDSFSLRAAKPLLNYLEIGWSNDYTWEKKNVRVNVGVVNGFAYTELTDRAQQEYRLVDQYGHRIKASKRIAHNSYYLLQPGAGVSIKLLSSAHHPEVYFTTQAKYRFLFGKEKFGQDRQASGYSINLGVSVIGFMKKSCRGMIHSKK